MDLPETAFLSPGADAWSLRWFTPAVEADLCGHATLATGYLILNRLEPQRDEVAFETRSGTLNVTHEIPVGTMPIGVSTASARQNAPPRSSVTRARTSSPGRPWRTNITRPS